MKVVDRCEACKGKDVDFSPAAFAKLFNGADTGRFNVHWTWDASDDDGSQGDGSDGTCGATKAWDSTRPYYVGDVVSYKSVFSPQGPS